MKFKVEHLANYLPFELKVLVLKNCFGDVFENPIIETFYGIKDKSFWVGHQNIDGGTRYDFKPILRPLTTMNENIQIGIDVFKPINVLAEMLTKTDKCNFDEDFAKEWILQLKVTELPFFLIQKLFEWHFDVFGLIEKELAVDYKSVFNKA